MSVKITSTTVEEIVEDVISDIEEPIARRVCNVRTPEGLNSDIGYPTLKTQLGDAHYGLDVARGAEVESSDEEVDSVSYNALKQVGTGQVTIESEIEAGKYDVDAVEMAIESAILDSMTAVELKFDNFLTDSNVWTDDNSVKSGNWDDGGSSSEPYKTSSKIARNALASDLTMVAGGKVIEELRSHPDTKEQDANYSGSGQVSTDTVVEKLRDAHRNINEVYIFENLYDDAQAGLAESGTRFFDKSIWIGSSRYCFMIDPQHPRNPYQLVEDDADRAATKINYGQFVDYVAPISKVGRFIADVFS